MDGQDGQDGGSEERRDEMCGDGGSSGLRKDMDGQDGKDGGSEERRDEMGGRDGGSSGLRKDLGGRDGGMRFEEVTKVIIGCSFEVIKELGVGFLESVYEKALIVALRHRGLLVCPQQAIEVLFRKQRVGIFYADLYVEGKVIVEIKAIKALAPEHQAQVINYLNASGIEVGLLLNFGSPKLEYKRFTRSKAPQSLSPCP